MMGENLAGLSDKAKYKADKDTLIKLFAQDSRASCGPQRLLVQDVVPRWAPTRPWLLRRGFSCGARLDHWGVSGLPLQPTAPHRKGMR